LCRAHAPRFRGPDRAGRYLVQLWRAPERRSASTTSHTITLDADDADELPRMQELFTTRLETIGRRDSLTVAW
jgi:hypothetical protein